MKSTKATREHQGMQSYITHELLTGQVIPPSNLLDRMKRYSWAKAFDQLSSLAAVVALEPRGPASDEVRQLTLRPLFDLRDDVPCRAMIIDGIAFLGDTAILAHEQVIYFLEALAILHGADTGPTPSATEVALWMLYANEHLSRWLDETQLPSPLEEIVAQLSPLTRFNTSHDFIRTTARGKLVLRSRPPQGRYSDQAEWENLQFKAFGRPFDEYFESFVAPLVLMSTRWGTRLGPGKIEPPVLEPSNWFAQTKINAAVGAGYLQSLTIDREAARKKLQAQCDNEGLPRSTRIFYETPFVELPSKWLAAASPWAVREQLRTGIWARLTLASNTDGGGRDWLSGFGLLVEIWCRDVARMAAATKKFKGRLLLSDEPGDPDEIEDVVVKDANWAALFSVKGRLMKADVARGLISKKEVIDLYNSYLFGKKKSEGTGALRLMDAKISKIRGGAYPTMPAKTKLLPVVVTYDSMGENAALYKWISERCVEEGLLQQPDVAAVTLATVDRFEMLMGLAAQGISTIDILRQKTSEQWRLLNLDQLLYELARTRPASLRLRELEKAFDQVMDATSARLFGGPTTKNKSGK